MISETSVSRALLYTAIQQPLLSPPPLPQSVSRALLYTAIQQPLLIMPNYATPFRAGQTQPLAGPGIPNPDPWCVATAK